MEDSEPPCSSAVGIAAVSMTAISVAGVGVDTRKTLRLSKSDRKIGHWRVDNDGQVTYKKVCLSKWLVIIDSLCADLQMFLGIFLRISKFILMFS